MKKLIAVIGVTAILAGGVAMADGLQDRLPEEFIFSSGAGAWGTSLTINADLTFFGEYSDSEMGEFADEYEYGTCYVCSFSGKFTDPVDVGDGTQTMKVESIAYAEEPGLEKIEDGIRYVSEEPYGIGDGTNFVIYPAGYEVSKVPEAAMEWISGLFGWWEDEMPETLPADVLYNTDGEYPFVQEWTQG